ncbi:MAG: oligosaccharide flippase family protein [Hyphomicrobiaceae bacterium]
MQTASTHTDKNLAQRIAGQSVFLFAGFGAAQVCSFARNAIIGHWLSKGDFGIAATITLLLQLLETMSDLGADRLIIQADDGDDKTLVGTAHATLIARGVITSAMLFLFAAPLSAFFAIPDAKWAFQVASLVPLIKGFMHLDPRRFQRRLENRPHLAVETAPQIIALIATIPVLTLFPSYQAVLWLALMQAILAVGVSHGFAERRYHTAWDPTKFWRLFKFGWPIWASAFPLIAVYQGDRIIIGHLLGMEALAGYTAAFMTAMVPGLIAGKVGNALMLPLLGRKKHNEQEFRSLYMLLTEATVVVAAGYLCVFLIAGEQILPLAFGENYTGLGTVIAWLAFMWAIRMVQAVPGMALMANGETRPLLVAGIIRAAGIVFVLWAATQGYGLAGIAAAGCGAELASLLYITLRVGRDRQNMKTGFLARTSLLMAVAAGALFTSHLIGAQSAMAVISQTIAIAMVVCSLLLCVLPLGRLTWSKLQTLRNTATS